MRATKARTQADAELAEWVTQETEIETSGWQLERWRQAGLLQRGETTYPGRGSVTSHGEAVRQQAVELARLSIKHRKHDELARVLFFRGLYVREDALRRALIRVIDDAEEWIGAVEVDNDSDLDRLDAKAQRLFEHVRRTTHGKQLQRRLGGRGETASAIAAGVCYNILHILRTGLPTSDEGYAELLDGSGLAGLFRDRINGLGPIAPDGSEEMKTILQEASLPYIRQRLARSSLEELAKARDLARLTFPFFKDLATLVTIWHQVPDALGFGALLGFEFDDLSLSSWIPFGLVVLDHARTEGAQELLTNIAQSADYFHQMAELARSMSPELVSAFRAGDTSAIDALPEEEQQRIRQSARSIRIAGQTAPFGSRDA